MGVSKNNGTPKSSILIGFSIVNPSILVVFPPIFGSTPVFFRILTMSLKKMVTSEGSTSSSMDAETAHPSYRDTMVK